MKNKFGLLSGVLLLTTLLSIDSSRGALTMIDHVTDSQGDPLVMPSTVYELGETNGVAPEFTDATLIDVVFAGFGGPSLPSTNLPATDVVIAITNLSLNDWVELWYIADDITTITNYDGLAGTDIGPGDTSTLFAFKIDAGGANTPLMTGDDGDGIFEFGETWQVILQDFATTGVASVSDIDSVGLGDGFSPGSGDPSSGSIVGVPVGQFVPEPSRALMLVVGGCWMGLRRRRR